MAQDTMFRLSVVRTYLLPSGGAILFQNGKCIEISNTDYELFRHLPIVFTLAELSEIMRSQLIPSVELSPEQFLCDGLSKGLFIKDNTDRNKSRSLMTSHICVSRGRPDTAFMHVHSFSNAYCESNIKIPILLISECERTISAVRIENISGVRVVGRPEKLKVIEQLSSVCDPDLLSWALLEQEGAPIVQTGVGRNVAQLLSAGSCSRWTDDDVKPVSLCWADHDPLDNEVRSGSPPVLKLLDYKTSVTTLSNPNNPSLPLLASEYLGLPVDTFSIANYNSKVRSSNQSSPIKDALARSDEHLKVRMVYPGIVGGSGYDPAVLSLGLQSGLEVGRSARLANSPVLAEGPWCMLTDTFIDAREILPPFFTSGRNQDGVFGAVVRFLYGALYSVHLPVASMHDANGIAVDANCHIYPRVSDALISLVDALPHYPMESPKVRFLRLADWFCYVSSLKDESFEACLRENLELYYSSLYEAALGVDDPIYEAYRYVLRNRLLYCTQSSSPLQLDDFCTIPRCAHGEGIRLGLLRYSKLLSVWPEIFRAAKEFRSEADDSVCR